VSDYQLDHDERALIDVATIPDEIDREHVFGYLGVFDSADEAHDAVYELLPESKKVDLDLLHRLQHKDVVLDVEQYGFKGDILDYQFLQRDGVGVVPPELDFSVENQTEKTIYVTCFTYQHTPRTPSWRFDKTPIIKLDPGESSLIDVDTISKKYDRMYMRGHLGVFDNPTDAEGATYELLEPTHKVGIGLLANLSHKKVVIHIQQYGIKGDFIDYTIHPTRTKQLSSLEELDPAHHEAWH